MCETIFDDNILTFQKFSIENLIEELTLYGESSIDNIDDRPFVNKNDIFKHMRSLSFINIPIEFIKHNTLEGLDNLEKLIFHKTKLKQFISNALQFTTMLEELNINDGFEKDEKFQFYSKLDGFLNDLKRVEIINTDAKINLGANFNELTFSGLINIRDLILRNNSIENIPQYTFHRILKTLKLIDLSQNRLKTLPMHIFELKILVEKSNDLLISFSENPWTYNCNIQSILFHKNGQNINVETRCLNSNKRIFSLDKFCNTQNLFNVKVEDEMKKEFLDENLSIASSKFDPNIPYSAEPEEIVSDEISKRIFNGFEDSIRIPPNKQIEVIEPTKKNETKSQESNEINDKIPILSNRNLSYTFPNKNRSRKHPGSPSKRRTQSRSNTGTQFRYPNSLPIQTSTNSTPIEDLNYDQNQASIPTTDSLSNQHYTDNVVQVDSLSNVYKISIAGPNQSYLEITTEKLPINHSKFICHLSNETKIKLIITNPTKKFQIEQIPFGDWLLSINNFSIKSALIGFERSDDFTAMTCVTNIENETKTVFKQKLPLNRAYRYCWMQLNSKIISPLNCIALIPPRKVKIINIDAWILTTHIACVISSIALSAVFAFLFGIFVAFMLAMAFPRKFRGKTLELKLVQNGRFKIGSMARNHLYDHRR